MASIFLLMALSLPLIFTKRRCQNFMTESDVHGLLRRAVLRMRASRALIAALAVLGSSLLCAALAVSWMRWSGREFVGTTVLAALPFAMMACAGVSAFLMSRPALASAASVLDRRAAISEHLVTWLHLRGLDEAKLDDMQRGFRAAQRESALRAADSIRLKTHLPLHWPAWSRAIWLAMILLLSAILMPANDLRSVKTFERSSGLGLTAGPGGGGGGKDASATLRETPRVQVLAPAELHKLELIATDPQLSAAQKSEALKELNDAIGGLPESELTPDVRQLLDTLRKDAAPPDAASKADGSIVKSANGEEKSARAAVVKPAEYKSFENVDKAWASSESQFGDVRERLARYYQKKR